MKSLLKMTWMETKLFFREPVGAFFTLIFPLMFLVLFGTIYGNKPTPMFGGLGTIDISIPAYTAMIIATTGLMGISITMAAYREHGILRRLRTTPISPLIVLLSQVIVYFLMTAFGMTLLIIAGKLVYHVQFEGNALNVFLGFTLSSLSFFSLGYILAGLLPTARTAQVVGLALLYPMLFLSGAGFPRELLPEVIKKFPPSCLSPMLSHCCVVCGSVKRGVCIPLKSLSCLRFWLRAYWFRSRHSVGNSRFICWNRLVQSSRCILLISLVFPLPIRGQQTFADALPAIILFLHSKK